jgi:alpha-N-arabinofuranosidase
MDTPAPRLLHRLGRLKLDRRLRPVLAVLSGLLAGELRAQAAAPAAAPTAEPAVPVLRISADQSAAKVSPILFGFMTEEINFSYDGGLYAELVRNRTFMDNAQDPVHWSLVKDADAAGTIALDHTQPLNGVLPVSLKLDITTGGPKQRAGIANEGYWGMAVRPETTYRASFYARSSAGFSGALTVSLESVNGATVFARATVTGLTGGWKKYETTLTTGKGFTPSATNRLVILANAPGTVWFDLVSLFPPTWNDRPNGMRKDIMQLLVDYKPGFLRFPGGNYLEGNTPATRFNWKNTLGDLAQRPGHLNDAWNYWSSDGVGLLEFLDWCEDMKAEPVLGVYAGLSLQGGRGNGVPLPQRLATDDALKPYVQDALEEIEYVTGDAATTKWGARRAQDGHPAPFALHYVEIGNEDNLSGGAPSYPGRFSQMAAAIRAQYPGLQLIATTSVRGGTAAPDVVDEHSYQRSPLTFQSDAAHYDKYDRNGPKIFVGEYATRVGAPTPNMDGALGDAAWLTGFERNSDVVIMASYAPLFVNVSDTTGANGTRSMQWATDLIGYDALNSYGSPSYHVQSMFSNHLGDVVLPVTAENIPMADRQMPVAAARRGAAAPSAQTLRVPTLFYSATRDTKAGRIYLKIVNTATSSQPIQVVVTGADINPNGQATLLGATKVNDTNSITDPDRVAPLTASVGGLGPTFTRPFPALSVTVLELDTK